MNAAPVQDIHEVELAQWLFTERTPAALLASELRFAPATDLAFCVDPSRLLGDTHARGDIDVLAIDHARLDQAIAIEIKRVKLSPEAYRSARPNKLQDLDKGCRQVGLLRSMGFHRSYLVVVVVFDGREQTGVSFPFRGPPPALVKVLRDKLRSLVFHAGVGVVVVEVTQPVDKDIRDSGAIGIWTHQHAQDVEQPAALTDGLRAFLRAAQHSSTADSSRSNPPPECLMKRLHDLFRPQQLKDVENAPLVMGMRHPTWFPLFNEESRAIDHLVHEAVSRVHCEPNGDGWLKDLIPRLLDFADINGASSALAELRAYGGLLEAGFSVEPIPRGDDSTADFQIDAGDGPITVEVFGKHQDKEQDRVLDAIHTPGAPLPAGVERHVHTVGRRSITTTIAEVLLAGRPDPTKPYDSIQANLVSRVCAIKQDEHQLPDDKPALLVIDFAHFGGPHVAQFLKPEQTAPIESGHRGTTCGAIWYAMYGWKDAPLFDEGSHNPVRMGHDGRFRLTGKRTTKLSGVLVVFCEGAVFLENPWAAHRIPDRTRLTLCRFPWFDLSRSIADWQPGDASKQIDLQRRMIETLERDRSHFECE